MTEINNPILAGLTKDEEKELLLLRCMRHRTFNKGDIILSSGDTISEIGVVERGSVLVESINAWGGRSILSVALPGQVFGESYAMLSVPLMVDVTAAEKCMVLLVDTRRLMSAEYALTSWQPRVLRNLVMIASSKNLSLSTRIFCTSSKKVRGRILAYLSGLSIENGSAEFDIPLDRQQMADFLNLDRSALSRELCRMRDEGLIEFRKNHFWLLNTDIS